MTSVTSTYSDDEVEVFFTGVRRHSGSDDPGEYEIDHIEIHTLKIRGEDCDPDTLSPRMRDTIMALADVSDWEDE